MIHVSYCASHGLKKKKTKQNRVCAHRGQQWQAGLTENIAKPNPSEESERQWSRGDREADLRDHPAVGAPEGGGVGLERWADFPPLKMKRKEASSWSG